MAGVDLNSPASRVCKKPTYSAWFLCVLLILASLVDWLFPSNQENIAGRIIPHILRCTILLFLFVTCIACHSAKRPFRSAIIKCAALFAVMFLMHFIARADLNYILVLTFAKHVYWILGLVVFYQMALENVITLKHISVIASLSILLIGIHSIREWFITGTLYRNGDAYLILWFLPLVFLTRKLKISSILLVTVAIFAIVFTMKRGAIIAMLSSMAVFVAVSVRISPKEAKKYLLLFCLVILICSVIFIWRWEDTVLRWQGRHEDDTLVFLTSGRSGYYSVVLRGWLEGDIFEKTFGAGFYAVGDLLRKKTLHNHGPYMYAHSDWVEILFDYGLVGTALFVCFHMSIISLVTKAFQHRHMFAPALAMGYTVFLLASIYSGTIMFHQTIFFSLLLGYSEAKITSDLLQKIGRLK